MADAADIEAMRRDVIVHERTAILMHRRRHVAGIAEQVRLGRLTEEEGMLCRRWINVFADDLAIGLHVEGDPVGVREAMRAIFKGMIGEKAHG